MKQNKLKLLLSLLMLCCASTVLAHDFEVDGIYYNKNGTQATVTYRGTSYYSAYSYSDDVTIPSTVTYDGMTYSVTAIGDHAFSKCAELMSVTIPNSVTSIGNGAFSGTSLESVTIPNSVTSIGYGVFNSCGLMSLKVQSGNTVYDSRDNCNAIIASASNTLVVGCKNTTIPNTVTAIGESAFGDCIGLTSMSIPNSVTTIDDGAFLSCALLTNITIPNSVTTIGKLAFGSCSSLANVIIGNSVTTINDYAFWQCVGLTSVTIGSSVNSICTGAFNGCNNLKRIICSAVTPPAMSSNIDFSDYTTPTLYVPAASLDVYSNTDYWNMFTTILSIEDISVEKFEADGIYYNAIGSEATVTYRGSSWNQYSNEYTGSVSIPSTVTYDGITYSVTAIGDHAFSGCTTLTSVNMTNSITTIGNSAFYCCSGLTSVTIPNRVTAIDNYVFYKCSGLTNVTIPNSVTTIGYRAFCACSGLTSVTIPNTVTTIESSAFSYCTSLTNVTIPNSVIAIGISVFESCSSLTSIAVESGNTKYDSRNNCNAIIETASNTLIAGCKNTTIPNSITTIGEYAFSSCTGLTSITIPNSVTSIGSAAFFECSGLTSVNIPNSVSIIKDYTFSECSGMTSVTIPNSVTSIGNSAFSNCTGLTSVTIPNSVATIGNYTFSNCTNLANVTIPNTVTSIGNSAFYFCSSLKNLTIPNSVSAIGYQAFSSCSSLTSIVVENENTKFDSRNNCNAIVETATNTLIAGCKNTTIPSSVTSIGNSAFYSCSNLTNVNIPNSVTSIGTYAFYKCPGLTSVTIPSSVTSIGNYAFGGCSGLTKVICRADTPPVMGNSNVFDNSTYSNVTLYVPGESLQEYKTTDYWNKFTNILSLDEMQNDQFEVNGIFYYIIDDEAVVTYRGTSYSQYSNEYSGTVNIPSTVTHDGITYPVTTIGENAFRGCNTLTSVIIPNSVTTIEEEAFFYCRSLKNVTIGNSVSFIGEEAFEGCSGLTDITLPNSLVHIDYGAFGKCSGLTSLTIPNSVKTIREAAFEGCTGLTGELIIPNSVTHLGEAAFIDCSGLTSVTILGPITRINDELFMDCSGLTSVTLPNTITCIGDASFEGCRSLTNLTIPNSVDSIIYSAFMDCTGLTEIAIPNSVSYIGKHIFYGCTDLKSVTIGNSVAEILENAFGGCTSLTSIVVADDNPVFDSRDNCNGIIETATNKLIVGCKNTIIPNTVITIGEAAFGEISSMTSITIPSSVTHLESWAFDACSGLTSVICKAATPPTMGNVYVFTYYDIPTLYVPAASLQAYKTTNYWNKFSRILPIEDYATPMPTITSELSIGAMTVAASGVGTVVLMVDGVVVDNPCVIPRTEHEQAVTVTATAQEDGKLVSDVATLRLTIPAILPLSTDNYLSMHDTTVVRGATVKIPVRMTNAATIVSFQTDISLPDGLEVALEDGDYLIEPSDRMTRTHALSSNQLSNGDIRVLCYSSNYKAFTGNSGDILFYIAVRGTATIEGDCVITLKNTLFTDRNFEELRAPDASATIHVLPFLLGDANGSGTVTVTDVVVTAQRVLELDPQPFIFDGADVNEDGIISVTDVTRIAYMVLNEAIPRAPLRSPILWNNGDRLSADAISLAAGETRTVALRLDNALSYTAMQLDLNLPEGLTATNFCLTERASDLALDMNTVGNGSTRVMCYSPALAAIKGDEGVLLTFDVTATGDVEGNITVDGIELVTTDCRTVMLDSFSIGVNDATSVNELNNTKAIADIEYFNLAGQRMDKPENGVTLVVTTYTDGTRITTKVIK